MHFLSYFFISLSVALLIKTNPLDLPMTDIYGIPAPDGRFPYMVLILYSPHGLCSSNCSTCSGSLIAPDKVITAANCFGGSSHPRTEHVLAIAGKSRLGEYMAKRINLPFSQSVDEKVFQLQERRPRHIKIHEDYNSTTFQHPIAMFTVTTEFELTHNVKPIYLSEEPFTIDGLFTIHGWDLGKENKRSYQLVYVYTAGFCQGDSGSPLVFYDKIWGIASHTIIPTSGIQCGMDMKRNYEDTYYELGFIKN